MQSTTICYLAGLLCLPPLVQQLPYSLTVLVATKVALEFAETFFCVTCGGSEMFAFGLIGAGTGVFLWTDPSSVW